MNQMVKDKNNSNKNNSSNSLADGRRQEWEHALLLAPFQRITSQLRGIFSVAVLQ